MDDYITKEAAEIRAERARVKAMEQALAIRTQKLIDEHLEAVTIREIATLVDLSPQRVGQLCYGRRARKQ